MRKSVLLLLLVLVALLGATAFAETTVEKPEAPRLASLDEGMRAAAANGRPVLVDFYTEW